MKKQYEQESDLNKLIFYPELRKLVPLSRSALWRLERDGQFPRRRLVTRTRVAWVLGEVMKWIAERKPVGAATMPAHNLPVSAPKPPEHERIEHRPNYLRDDD